MKKRLFGRKKVFSIICIAVFIAGHSCSLYFSLFADALPVFNPQDSDISISETFSVPFEADNSFSSLPSSTDVSSLAESFTSIVTASSIPNVLNNSTYKETEEDKKQDPTLTNKPVDDDRNNSSSLTDTVPKKDTVTEVTPYVVRVTGNDVRLRTVMSTASDSSIYTKVNSGQRLLCNAECTSKTGNSWRRVVYEGKTLYISALYTEATNESIDSLNSKPQSSSSSAVSSAISSAPSSSASSTGSSVSSSTVSSPSNLQGWQVIDGKTYYYVNGKPITGWQVIGGLRHLFDSSGVKISKVGIDVSRYQTNIDWESVKEAGVDFAIIRVGYRGYGTGKLTLDTYFEKNIKGATAAGVPCGVYIYSTAINTAEALEEAAFVLSAVKNYKLDYPIMYDVERYTDRCAGMTKKQFTDNTIAFLEAIKSAGYKAMYYTYRSFLQNHLEYERLKNYDLWLAVYSNAADDSPVNKYNYKIWQYSDSGKINGISGNVDLNIQVQPV
ncbi:MAG: glycoside hydrolase family 25 protein [Clostridia bacterium]|nr:glycoside hydrolase family 25 protein [Clostridia bacterium]